MKARESIKITIGIIVYLAILPLIMITQYAYIKILKKKGELYE